MDVGRLRLDPVRRLVLTDCTVDFATRHVFRREGNRTRLTPKEAGLLARLVASSGETVPRRTLLTEVWEYASSVESRAVDVAVRTLRRKIEKHHREPVHVVTVYGEGYRFVPAAPAANVPQSEGAWPPLVSGSEPVGRGSLVAQATELLARSRLMTLWGSPGIGKSTVAGLVAREVASGGPVMWVALEGAKSEAQLVDRVAAELGIPERRADNLDMALANLAATTVVLDQADGLDPSALRRIGGWARGRCTARFLLTRRERCWLDGESALVVPPLMTSDAVALLCEAAGRLGTRISSSNKAIRAVAEQLDGIPLALHLAAGRVGHLGVAGLTGALSDPLAVLSDAGRGGLRAILEESWGQLSPRLQQVAMWLSLWSGPFDLTDAEACTGAPPVEDLIALVDAGWVHPWSGRSGSFHVLRPLRAAARSHADEATEDRVRRSIADSLGRRVYEPEDLQDSQVAMALRAIEWMLETDPELGATIALGLVQNNTVSVPIRRLSGLIERLRASGVGTATANELLVGQAKIGVLTGRVRQTLELLAELPEELPAALGATAEVVRGHCYFQTREYADALRAYTAGYDGAVRCADRSLEARGRHGQGVILRVTGRWDEARVPLTQARSLAREVGDNAVWRTATMALAELCLDQGRLEEAEVLAAQALAATHPAHSGDVAQTSFLLAAVHAGQGKATAALDRLTESLRRYTAVGAAFDVAVCTHNLAIVHLELGDPAAALAMLDEYETWRKEVATALPPNHALATRAIAHHLAGHREVATSLYNEVVSAPSTPPMIKLFARALSLDLLPESQAVEALAALEPEAPTTPGGPAMLSMGQAIVARKLGDGEALESAVEAWQGHVLDAPARLRPALRIGKNTFALG